MQNTGSAIQRESYGFQAERVRAIQVSRRIARSFLVAHTNIVFSIRLPVFRVTRRLTGRRNDRREAEMSVPLPLGSRGV